MWKDIAFIIHERVYLEHKADDIDVFDISTATRRHSFYECIPPPMHKIHVGSVSYCYGCSCYFGNSYCYKFSHLQCKEWGLQLRDTFGPLLGTGDYGHLVTEHASMLMRTFGSMRELVIKDSGALIRSTAGYISKRQIMTCTRQIHQVSF
jgi:hypothetical protein